PVTAWLVLDVSGRVVGEKLTQLRGAGEAFLSRLKDSDRAALLTFSHEVRLRTTTEAAPSAVRAALASTQAGGATALNDAVYAAATLADPRVGRPVLVVFSDGQDTLSVLPPEAVRLVVRESDLVVYGVTLPPDPFRGGVNRLAYLTDSRADRRGAGNDRYGMTAPADDMARIKRVAKDEPSLLRDLAEDSGGRVWNAAGGNQLQDAFTRVVEEVKSRYVLRYEPRGVAKTGWHNLQVRLKTGKAEVRARRGYESR
ncbi:MAG: VWA domain-containing protein, partial [bacterium]